MLFIVYILQPMTNNIFYKFANAFLERLKWKIMQGYKFDIIRNAMRGKTN